MALMKPPTKTDSFEDYSQPIDALNSLPTARRDQVIQARRSYRLISDKKMQQVREQTGKRSSSAERAKSNQLELETSEPHADRSKIKPPGHHLADYEEPWDLRLPVFQRAFRRDATPEGAVSRAPPPQVPPPPTPDSKEGEYEDPWESTPRAVHPYASHEPLPPVPRPPKPAHLNGPEQPRGPSGSSRSTRSQSEPPEIDTNKSLEDQPWYHGTIGRHHAEEILSRMPDFSFLVRKSETSLTSYSLSLKCSAHAENLPYIHIKIDMGNDLGYVVGEFSKPFPTVPEAIKYYTSHKLRIRGADHKRLKYPVNVQ